jgi:hypothetical protein
MIPRERDPGAEFNELSLLDNWISMVIEYQGVPLCVCFLDMCSISCSCILPLKGPRPTTQSPTAKPLSLSGYISHSIPLFRSFSQNKSCLGLRNHP